MTQNEPACVCAIDCGFGKAVKGFKIARDATWLDFSVFHFKLFTIKRLQLKKMHSLHFAASLRCQTKIVLAKRENNQNTCLNILPFFCFCPFHFSFLKHLARFVLMTIRIISSRCRFALKLKLSDCSN